MMGLGFSAEEPFAVEMIKLAQVFGFAFHHPFSEEHPSPINGYDPLRPALYARSGDFMGSRMFSRRDYSQQIAAVLGKSELNKEEKNRNLAGIMPSVHAAHPEIRATFSEEARRCCSLSEKEQGKRSHNSDYFLGAWPALLQALHAVLDPRHQPAVIFCYGGRHKTGMLSLALRYLQDPRWYFGPRQTRGIFPKLDSSLFLEQVSSEAGAWGVRSRRMHKRQALALILRGKVYEAMGRRDLSLLARYRQVALNPAEQEYAGHNPGEFRLVNLSSLRSMFRLLWANSPEFEAALLRHNEGFLSKEDLERIKTELDQLRQKMQRLVTRAG
jgi:hypothetical protein